jgi:hypothetical protein
MSMVAYAYNSGEIGRRILVQVWPWTKTVDPIQKIIKAEKGF